MKQRIKLADRQLPNYSKGEEIFNMVSHIVGAALGIAALVLCIIVSARHHSGIGVVSSCIYGVTLIVLYTMSSVYHGLRPGMGKKVMQVLDHCTIYFLIAGSYTPVLLVAMMPKYPVIAWVLFGIVWGCAVVACTLTAIDLKKYNVFSMICYLAMGWCIIFFIRQTFEVMGMVELYYLFPVELLILLVLFYMGLEKTTDICTLSSIYYFTWKHPSFFCNFTLCVTTIIF